MACLWEGLKRKLGGLRNNSARHPQQNAFVLFKPCSSQISGQFELTPPVFGQVIDFGLVSKIRG
jgi:hypothetical protein